MDAGAVVRCYLEALAAHDWEGLAATLAPDVVRVGPYRDVFEGREAYAAFLEKVVSELRGYELRVERVVATGAVVLVRLSETVDDVEGGRLRTEEALVFDVEPGGLIARVEVFTQRSFTL